jgi:aldehyde:ferredoxin oxidoreductase
MTARFGFHGRVLHVDLTQRTSEIEELDEDFYRVNVGGAMLGTYFLLRDTEPGIDPLGPANLLIFASGILTGLQAVGLPLHSVVAKSPMTGGIGEARAQGTWGVALKSSGVDALIFHGRSESPVTVAVDDARASFHDAVGQWGMTIGEATDELEKAFGPDIQVAAIGPAGERLVRFASVITNRTFAAARMGMGAVMGSKLLKAVVLRGNHPPPIADEPALRSMTEWYAANMWDNEVCRSMLELPGFNLDIYWHHRWGMSLPVRNYRQSTFEHIERYRPEVVAGFYRNVAACSGCPQDCIKVMHPSGSNDLDPRASGLHQDAIGAFGSNLGLPDVADALRANNLCNQLGMDPSSLGFTLSFAMECVEEGALGAGDVPRGFRFGGALAALDVMRDTAQRQGFGELISQGTKRGAATIGHGAERFALQVKGLEMEPWDPRSQQNLGLGYAVAPYGPRHDVCEHDADWDSDPNVGFPHSIDSGRTLGVLGFMPMNYMGLDKVHRFKALNEFYSAADALGVCIFASDPARLLNVTRITAMVQGATGWDTSAFEVMRWGRRRNHIMRMYNYREGFNAADDHLPDRFYEDPNPVGPRTGRGFNREALREAIDFYYQMMGWDTTGYPLPATISEYHLPASTRH